MFQCTVLRPNEQRCEEEAHLLVCRGMVASGADHRPFSWLVDEVMEDVGGLPTHAHRYGTCVWCGQGVPKPLPRLHRQSALQHPVSQPSDPRLSLLLTSCYTRLLLCQQPVLQPPTTSFPQPVKSAPARHPSLLSLIVLVC